MADGYSNEKSAAWVLLAIERAGFRNPTPSVRDLIAAADSINHAIISHGELEAGVALLLGCGYAQPDGFVLTEAASALLRSLRRENEPPLETWPKLEAHLANWVVAAEGTRLTQCVSQAEYKKAVSSYAVNMPHPLWNRG